MSETDKVREEMVRNAVLTAARRHYGTAHANANPAIYWPTVDMLIAAYDTLRAYDQRAAERGDAMGDVPNMPLGHEPNGRPFKDAPSRTAEDERADVVARLRRRAAVLRAANQPTAAAAVDLAMEDIESGGHVHPRPLRHDVTCKEGG